MGAGDPTGHWAGFIGISFNRTTFGGTGTISLGVSFDGKGNIASTLIAGGGGSSGAFGASVGITAAVSFDAPDIDAVGGASTVVGGSGGVGLVAGGDIALSKYAPGKYYAMGSETVGVGLKTTYAGLPVEGHVMGSNTIYGPRTSTTEIQKGVQKGVKNVTAGINKALFPKACVDPACRKVDFGQYLPKQMRQQKGYNQE